MLYLQGSKVEESKMVEAAGIEPALSAPPLSANVGHDAPQVGPNHPTHGHLYEAIANSQGPSGQPARDRTDSARTSAEHTRSRQDSTSVLPPELAGVVALWPKLPEHIKAAVLALIGTVKR